MEFRDYVRSLRRSWPILLAGLLVGLLLGGVASLVSAPRYQAATQLFLTVESGSEATTNDLVQGSNLAQQRVRTYVLVATSSRVLEPVVERLDLDLTAAQLASRVTATTPLNTVIIEISVDDGDPQRAAELANAITDSFIDVIDELERAGSAGASPVSLETIQSATPPAAPYSPNIQLNIAFGGLIGLTLALAATLLLAVLDRRVRRVSDVEVLTDRPVIGVIPADSGAARQPLVGEATSGPRAEAYRSLRTNLRFALPSAQGRAVVVTSADDGEGRTTTVANLALTLVDAGGRVAVVDADLRDPALASLLGVSGGPGLSDVLRGEASLAEVVHARAGGALTVVGAGSPASNPSELLGSAWMSEVVKQLAAHHDYVLIDAPSALGVTDAVVLAAACDAVVLVSAVGVGRRDRFAAAEEALARVAANVVGVVVTRVGAGDADSDRLPRRIAAERG